MNKCNPYDVSEGPIGARRFQPDKVSVHNRSQASLVVCQLRNALLIVEKAGKECDDDNTDSAA